MTLVDLHLVFFCLAFVCKIGHSCLLSKPILYSESVSGEAHPDQGEIVSV